MPKADKKTKLCWNCEGSVGRDAVNCKYCGVYLHQNENQEIDSEESEETEDFKESSSYTMAEFKEEKIEIPRSPFKAEETEILASANKNTTAAQDVLTHSQSW